MAWQARVRYGLCRTKCVTRGRHSRDGWTSCCDQGAGWTPVARDRQFRGSLRGCRASTASVSTTIPRAGGTLTWLWRSLPRRPSACGCSRRRSSPVVRHPLVLASLANSLEEIAPNRICLTVAPGFISTRSIGQPRAGVAVMREAVGELRSLLAGETVGFGPTATRLRNRSGRPPVYMLAAGPRMIELAGEVADGAFIMAGLHPDSIRAARRHLDVGAAESVSPLPTSRWSLW